MKNELDNTERNYEISEFLEPRLRQIKATGKNYNTKK